MGCELRASSLMRKGTGQKDNLWVYPPSYKCSTANIWSTGPAVPPATMLRTVLPTHGVERAHF
jgi:hypothetical protein